MKRMIALLALLVAVLALSACSALTVEQLYSLPKRSTKFNNLQTAIDAAMNDLEYAAPVTGENQQTVQTADLDGDGEYEYLLFARSSGEKPMRILIFSRHGESYALTDTIESLGTAFQRVEYVNMDSRPGVELIVGRSVSDQLMGAVSVYTFTGGRSEQLMSVSYEEFATADLDGNGCGELLIISRSDAEGGNGVAALYSYDSGTMVRSTEASLSAPAERIKRMMVSRLSGGIPAVYVASSLNEQAIITDVLAVKNDMFANISLSSDSGTSVQTLRNYYVYADDIDDDKELELPCLMHMATGRPYPNENDQNQYLIRWYTMTIDGMEVDKQYTFHNFGAGWYILLDRAWAYRILVTQEGGTYTFYMWDTDFSQARKLFTVYSLSGSDRETAAMIDGRFLLHRGDGTIYCAKLEDLAAEYDITQESLTNHFRQIHIEWKTGET